MALADQNHHSQHPLQGGYAARLSHIPDYSRSGAKIKGRLLPAVAA